MKILIGYHQRSGSTLLQHILNEHSQIQSYSDANSLLVLPVIMAGYDPPGNVCVKPLDVFFMFRNKRLLDVFDKFIWLARDPRDSYLSALEIKFAYNFWLPGKKFRGIDLNLLKRWRVVYRTYFKHQDRWHLLRYEDLSQKPEETLRKLFGYLDLPYEPVYPFQEFNLMAGGDPKLRQTRTIHKKSVTRYKKQMPRQQQMVFRRFLRTEMRKLGYWSND
jgi:hypothetical protein